MSLYRRGNVWYIQFTNPHGERVQRSAGTTDRRAAQELHDKLKAEAWRVTKLGEQPGYVWEDAALRWLTEQAHKRSIENDRQHCRFVDKYLRGKKLTEIDVRMIERLRRAKLAEGVSEAAANRVMATVRAILNRAQKQWAWIPQAPYVRMAPEPQKRIRWLTKAEAARLLSHLPPHLRDITEFALLTGLRQSNILGLTWDQVDLARGVAWIHPEDAKAGKAIGVPLNSRARTLILSRSQGDSPLVFTYEGHGILRANNTAWRNGLKKAGITNFRFHDLRHTWASWHVQAGTPLHVLQELGGWADSKMVQRYAHLSPAHLADHAEAVTFLLQGNEEGPDKGA